MTVARPVDVGAGSTFRTSWRTALAGTGWELAAMPLIGVILWASGAPLDAALIAFLLACVPVLVACSLLRYRLGGVGEVRVAPEAVVVVGHSGLERRIDRADLTDAWLDKRWVLRTRDERVVVRDEGFTADDWLALSAALTGWKVEGAGGRMPAVSVDRQRGEVEFRVHRPWLPSLASLTFAFLLLGATALCWKDYRDGSWADDPQITVLFPLLGGLLAVAFGITLARAVRRVTFGTEEMTFERLVGGLRVVAYRDVVDAYGAYVDTTAGTFYVGRRDDDVFVRLLNERLEDEQLTGRRWVTAMLWLQPRVLLGSLAGGLLLWAASVRVAGGLNTGEGWEEVLAFGVLAAYGLALWGGIHLWATRLLRHAD